MGKLSTDGVVMGIFVSSTRFCSEPKTALKYI